MNRLSLFLTFLCLPAFLFAQTPTCDCLANLNKTIQETTTNYAGYPAKINPITINDYNTLVQALRQKASEEKKAKKCYYIIREYVKFFKDKHFILSYLNEKDFDSTAINYSSSYFRKNASSNTLLPVEGIWTNPDSTTKIAIQKMPDGSFSALKLESQTDSFPKGFVYFTLVPDGQQFIVRPYNSFVSTDFPAKQIGQLLFLWNHEAWGKLSPQQMSAEESTELATWKNNNHGLRFWKPTPDVACLKIPTFYNNDNRVQQLVAANDSVIRNTEYLIVDLTGNGGGNTGWVYFLPYFMTNAVIQEPSYLRVTPDNIKKELPDLAYFVENPISDAYKKYFPDSILNAYKKAYRELSVTTDPFYPIPSVVFPLDSVMEYPKKIALVVDNFCGSSTEYFFYLSRQSKKTTTYGTNTIGMMDYHGMSAPTPLPYNKFILTIPITQSSWTDKHPIDQTGFQPEVAIPLPQDQWIDFIVRDLTSGKP